MLFQGLVIEQVCSTQLWGHKILVLNKFNFHQAIKDNVYVDVKGFLFNACKTSLSHIVGWICQILWKGKKVLMNE